jgi:ABC-type polysaccharide transport system permease subunit
MRGSPSVGLQEIGLWLQVPHCWLLLENSLVISVYALVAVAGASIIRALALNEAKHRQFKKKV